MRGPIRARDDHTNNESRRPSGLDLDEVMALTEDLRNLLAVITACADAMRRNAARRLSVDGDRRDLDVACDRSTRVLDRLARIEQPPAARQPINVNLAVFDGSEMLVRALGDRIDLNVRLAPSLDPVLAASMEIDRILMNLTVNGRHAMPDGGVLAIETTLVKEAPAGLRPPDVRARSYVRLTVFDTGPGMPSQTRLRVLGGTPLRDHAAAEVGLAAVAHTVRALGGTLRIEGDDGQGGRIVIELPCVESTPE